MTGFPVLISTQKNGPGLVFWPQATQLAAFLGGDIKTSPLMTPLKKEKPVNQ
jgi:hypothetical protein